MKRNGPSNSLGRSFNELVTDEICDLFNSKSFISHGNLYSYQLLLSTASPKPGVSTIVSDSCTPPSFNTTLEVSTCMNRDGKTN